MSLFRSFFLFLCCLAAFPAWAQSLPGAPAGTGAFVLGVTDSLQSRFLGERRKLNIYLPEGYGNDTARYPVIYLLDGSANEDFVHITGIVQFLTMIGSMPPSIVVGIANTDRRRDFTHPTLVAEDLRKAPTGGGSARFISFIEYELQPYVNTRYRVQASPLLIGQSLGGLLATEILLKHPQLFDKYIIVSPSLWWNKQSLLAEAPALLQKPAAKPQFVCVSVGTEGAEMETVARRLYSLLKAAPGRKAFFMPFPKESHLSILHHCAYKALEKVYATH